MCRLLAITSDEFMTPIRALQGLQVMREGYDGSGVGLLLRDLGGPFQKMKRSPILSGIFSDAGLRKLDQYMLQKGFLTKFKISFRLPHPPPTGIPRREIYLIRAYDYPSDWESFEKEEINSRLMGMRLDLRKLGEHGTDMIVFSFWPDTIIIKELGEPMAIAEYLQLDRKELSARIVMVQGRQNTNYAVDLYACHPFFLQGFSTMTNGENTAFVSNREYLISRGFPGYSGYFSDSEVFTHILHYAIESLGLGLEAFKHIITPLAENALEQHAQAGLLKHLKQSCRQLIIDGPNCVVGCLPDGTLFMLQDSKKLRPGVVGGRPGLYAFASEICGLDAVIPERDKAKDFQPMHLDTAIVKPDRREMLVSRQTDALLLN